MKRRKFIKSTAIGLAGAGLMPLSAHSLQKTFSNDLYPHAVRVENGEPAALLQTALKELGGLKRFISEGDEVVIKPNMGWDRAPEYAANTNPDLVAEVVKATFKAGAKSVKVFDRTCNSPRRCYRNSLIEEKAAEAGADVLHVRDNRFEKIAINGKTIDEWRIYRDYLEADKVINIPVAKHHGLGGVTLGLKNLMGVMGGRRGSLHSYFATKLIDIDSKILPQLTIIDAYRILLDNGPSGGDLDDVKLAKTLIASPCIVTADFLGLSLFNRSLEDIGHIKEAADRGLNLYDLNNLNVKTVRLV